MTTITGKHNTHPVVPSFNVPLHLPLANAYWYQGMRPWNKCRHLAMKHLLPIVLRVELNTTPPASAPLHFSPEYPAFLRKEIFRKDRDTDPGNNPFPVDGGDLACIFEDVTYVAIRPEWEREQFAVMGGMGRGGVKSECARG